jgi:polysaccharide pyruvyl transferase WcaK-like protein
MIRTPDARPPAILIAGCCYGAGNIGDEGILVGLLKMVRTISPGSRIGVIGESPSEIHRMHGVEAWSRYPLWRLFRIMREFDLLLMGGGTLADDSLGLGYPIQYSSALIAMGRLLRLKVMISAIGANRFSTRRGKMLVRFFYGNADRITVRDEASRNVLTGIGIRKPIVAAADPAFLLQPGDQAEGLALLREAGVQPGGTPLVGISVLNERYGSLTTYKRAIALACDRLIAERHATPVFVCHESREDYDWPAVQETMSYMAHRDRARILPPRFYHPREMLNFISCLDFAFGMRMHFLIYASACGVPFAALSRADKVDNFCSLFDLSPAGHVGRTDIGQFAERILQDFDRRNEIRRQILARRDEIRRRAWHTGNVLDGLLRSMGHATSCVPAGTLTCHSGESGSHE